jgi:hypothetical protein
MRNVVLSAVLERSRLIPPPHPAQRRLFTLRKGWQKPANRMMAKAKNRETHP